MTTVQITLPDQLAQEAQGPGLLSPEAVADEIGAILADRRARTTG